MDQRYLLCKCLYYHHELVGQELMAGRFSGWVLLYQEIVVLYNSSINIIYDEEVSVLSLWSLKKVNMWRTWIMEKMRGTWNRSNLKRQSKSGLASKWVLKCCGVLLVQLAAFYAWVVNGNISWIFLFLLAIDFDTWVVKDISPFLVNLLFAMESNVSF